MVHPVRTDSYRRRGRLVQSFYLLFSQRRPEPGAPDDPADYPSLLPFLRAGAAAFWWLERHPCHGPLWGLVICAERRAAAIRRLVTCFAGTFRPACPVRCAQGVRGDALRGFLVPQFVWKNELDGPADQASLIRFFLPASGMVSSSSRASHKSACSRFGPHMATSGLSDAHTAGLCGRPNRRQRNCASSCTQGTPAGLPMPSIPGGIPGMGDVMDGAMQHAPHPSRQGRGAGGLQGIPGLFRAGVP